MYGLLLPETDTCVSKKEGEPESKPTAAESVQLRHKASDKGVAMRNTKKTRNRKSAVYGESDDVASSSDNTKTAAAALSSDKTKSPVHDMKVKLVSFSPENSIDKGDESFDGVLETRQGKVSDLVKQFEEEEKAIESKQQSSISAGSENNVKEVQNGESGEKEKGKKKRPSSKAFDMFETSGIIMGMVSSLPTLCEAESLQSYYCEICISTPGRTIISLQTKSSLLCLGSQYHPSSRQLLLFILNQSDNRGDQR